MKIERQSLLSKVQELIWHRDFIDSFINDAHRKLRSEKDPNRRWKLQQQIIWGERRKESLNSEIHPYIDQIPELRESSSPASSQNTSSKFSILRFLVPKKAREQIYENLTQELRIRWLEAIQAGASQSELRLLKVLLWIKAVLYLFGTLLVVLKTLVTKAVLFWEVFKIFRG